ncbi:sensor histidine kinase [Nonomuraea sp. B1E8]|uniref:sensor histidine kinase n=1 Tax=unclassified Nonomuraea TaxID=2593643 RepID=UPI00325E9608
MDDRHPFFARRLSRIQLIMLDLAVGLCFGSVAFTMAVNATALPPWLRFALPFGLGLLLSVRRLWPLPVFCLTLALAVFAVMTDAIGFAYLAPAYALYIVALSDRVGPLIPSSAIGGLSLVTLFGLTLAGAPKESAPDWLVHFDKPLMGIAALGGSWTIGRAVHERRHYAAREAERLASQAVTDERLRIARELHDVVTHSVGLIAVKAGVANHVMSTRPEEAHDALRVIETASRSALVEMRHLLGMLRSTNVPDLVPAPGIDGLEDLAEQARLAGVDVDLQVRIGGDGCAGPVSGADAHDPRDRLPEGAGLSVYRIVQEALTNVAKHAAPARCRVSVVADGKDVRIEVMDDGPGRRTSLSAGTGHGLIGMRERVMMYGGTFEAGSRPGSGFRVFAQLPYQEAP